MLPREFATVPLPLVPDISMQLLSFRWGLPKKDKAFRIL
jgi:hypothetical protein